LNVPSPATGAEEQRPSASKKTEGAIMTDQTYPPAADIVKNAHIDIATYEKMYEASVSDPDTFWGDEARKRLDWIEPFTKVKDTNFTLGEVSIKWFEDGVLNVAHNCIDRHLATRGDQTAIIFEPDDPETPAQHITYNELHEKVSRMANVLLAQASMA
jgi:acetyl-CoA synthetase